MDRGKSDEQRKIVANLKKLGLANDVIAKASGMSVKEIEKI